MNNPKRVLYWSEPILDTANLDKQLQATASSGFDNILLWSLHVNQPMEYKGEQFVLGDLSWNDKLLVSSRSGKSVFDPTNSFTKLATRLKNLAGTTKKIFFSIGSEPPEDRPGDFGTIKELFSTIDGQDTLQNNFGVLKEALAIVTGFDFDVEDCFDVPSTAWLTEVLAIKFKKAITYCPAGAEEWWEQCIEAVYSGLKRQPVIGFNLQCYSGGSTNDPVSWAKHIKDNKEKNGVENASSFIVPGYPANNKGGDAPGLCPSDFTTTLTPYNGKVGGAFVWNSTNIFDKPAPCEGRIPTVNDYATAITKALQ